MFLETRKTVGPTTVCGANEPALPSCANYVCNVCCASVLCTNLSCELTVQIIWARSLISAYSLFCKITWATCRANSRCNSPCTLRNALRKRSRVCVRKASSLSKPLCATCCKFLCASFSAQVPCTSFSAQVAVQVPLHEFFEQASLRKFCKILGSSLLCKFLCTLFICPVLLFASFSSREVCTSQRSQCTLRVALWLPTSDFRAGATNCTTSSRRHCASSLLNKLHFLCSCTSARRFLAEGPAPQTNASTLSLLHINIAQDREQTISYVMGVCTSTRIAFPACRFRHETRRGCHFL